jgi:hypothetical protein
MIPPLRNPFGLALPAIVLLAGASSIHAAEPLNSLKITEVVQDVNVIDASSKKEHSAAVNALFKTPDLLNTGANSRAELVSEDGTVTRVGSNTTFSFSPNKRQVNLQKGSVLFNSPTGKGGGEIQTKGASAAVLGTSIIVTATKNGGFKLLVLEGNAKATLPNGKTSTLEAGQLIFVMPGSNLFGPTIEFRLRDQVGSSNLVKGFKTALPSLAKITAATKRQEKKIASGESEATTEKVGDREILDWKRIDSTFRFSREEHYQYQPHSN